MPYTRALMCMHLYFNIFKYNCMYLYSKTFFKGNAFIFEHFRMEIKNFYLAPIIVKLREYIIIIYRYTSHKTQRYRHS